MDYDEITHDKTRNEDPYLFYFANKGLYEDIP